MYDLGIGEPGLSRLGRSKPGSLTLLTAELTQSEALDAIGAMVVSFPYGEFFNS